MGLYGDLDFCGDLIQGLSSGNFEGLGLDSGSSRSGRSDGSDMRKIGKTGERVLRFCDSPIKVFDAVFYLSNYVFPHF